jgi:hypothetical protein
VGRVDRAQRRAARDGHEGWSDAEIARAIQQGVRRDGTRLMPPMVYDCYRNMDATDMQALIGYLRSLEPKPFAAPAASR